MSLTKRDFAALAQAIAKAHSVLGDSLATDANNEYGSVTESTAPRILDALAGDIANLCASHNPRFNRAKFLAACKSEEA